MTAATLEITRHTTTSADGTTIGYLSLGDGPGLVIVHGAMQSAASQLDLARLLATAGRAVHLIDRRGRGDSGPYPASPTTALEVDDLVAVLSATDSHDVFGVSSGALIAARAALAPGESGIHRLAIFEPPLVDNGSMSLDFLDRFAREQAAADVPSMMVTAMIGAEMGPPLMGALPRPVLRAITRRMLGTDDARELVDGAVHVRLMAAALRGDFAVVRENAERAADFAALPSSLQVLLVRGTKTRPYLRAGIEALARVLPGARLAELTGTNHGVTSNRADWGKPDLIAPVLNEFFSTSG